MLFIAGNTNILCGQKPDCSPCRDSGCDDFGKYVRFEPRTFCRGIIIIIIIIIGSKEAWSRTTETIKYVFRSR